MKKLAKSKRYWTTRFRLSPGARCQSSFLVASQLFHRISLKQFVIRARLDTILSRQQLTELNSRRARSFVGKLLRLACVMSIFNLMALVMTQIATGRSVTYSM